MNLIIASLSPHAQSLLGKGEPFTAQQGEELESAGQHSSYAYFLDKGLASRVASFDGQSLDIGMIGSEGFVCSGLLEPDDKVDFKCLMRISGSGHRYPSQVVKAAMTGDTPLGLSLRQAARSFSTQVGENAWSAGVSTLNVRLARWLLMAADRAGLELEITHEEMAEVLGVRRSGVTLAMHVYEGLHLVKGSRGHIKIVDRSGLSQLVGNS
jgi:CRP-like cAMP-binding protein